jgi:GNAT superfamily N-acetyltransferase
MEIAVRELNSADEVGVVEMMARFRVVLSEVRGRRHELDLKAAMEELVDYQEKEYPIYVAVDDMGELAGYLVCRVDGEVVWAESLYVDPGWRRRGVGSALYARAEALAKQLGGDLPYNWVDPENEAIIQFLGKRGYDVLNLVELRKGREGERLGTLRVGRNVFRR